MADFAVSFAAPIVPAPNAGATPVASDAETGAFGAMVETAFAQGIPAVPDDSGIESSRPVAAPGFDFTALVAAISAKAGDPQAVIASEFKPGPVSPAVGSLAPDGAGWVGTDGNQPKPVSPAGAPLAPEFATLPVVVADAEAPVQPQPAIPVVNPEPASNMPLPGANGPAKPIVTASAELTPSDLDASLPRVAPVMPEPVSPLAQLAVADPVRLVRNVGVHGDVSVVANPDDEILAAPQAPATPVKPAQLANPQALLAAIQKQSKPVDDSPQALLDSVIDPAEQGVDPLLALGERLPMAADAKPVAQPVDPKPNLVQQSFMTAMAGFISDRDSFAEPDPLMGKPAHVHPSATADLFAEVPVVTGGDDVEADGTNVSAAPELAMPAAVAGLPIPPVVIPAIVPVANAAIQAPLAPPSGPVQIETNAVQSAAPTPAVTAIVEPALHQVPLSKATGGQDFVAVEPEASDAPAPVAAKAVASVPTTPEFAQDETAVTTSAPGANPLAQVVRPEAHTEPKPVMSSVEPKVAPLPNALPATTNLAQDVEEPVAPSVTMAPQQPVPAEAGKAAEALPAKSASVMAFNRPASPDLPVALTPIQQAAVQASAAAPAVAAEVVVDPTPVAVGQFAPAATEIAEMVQPGLVSPKPAAKGDRKADPLLAGLKVVKAHAAPETADAGADDLSVEGPDAPVTKLADLLPSTASLAGDRTLPKPVDPAIVAPKHHPVADADKLAAVQAKIPAVTTDTADRVDVSQPALKAAEGVAIAAHRFAERIKGEGKQVASDDLALPVLPQTNAQTQQIGLPVAMREPVVAAAVTLQQVASKIVEHADNGESSFEIRLNPADLGRMDVRLDFNDKGEARAHIAVERRETLDLLARDQRQIEKTLRDAGYDARDGSLSLSLRQGGAGDRQSFAGRDPEPWRETRSNDNQTIEIERPVPVAAYRPRSNAVLDVRI